MKYILKVGGGEAEKDDQLGGEGGTGAHTGELIQGKGSIIWNVFQNTIELCLVYINENRKTPISFAKNLPKYMKIH